MGPFCFFPLGLGPEMTCPCAQLLVYCELNEQIQCRLRKKNAMVIPKHDGTVKVRFRTDVVEVVMTAPTLALAKRSHTN